MTELHVEKKPNYSWIAWLLLLAGIAALAYWFFAVRPNYANNVVVNDTTQTDQPVVNDGNAVAAATEAEFANVNFDAPVSRLDEITDASVKVRDDGTYSIYDLGNNILFVKGESTLKPSSKPQMDLIAKSIKQRYVGKKIAIFGNADSDGDAAMNVDLAKTRAEAVKNMLVQDAGINAADVSIKSFGESKPVAPNTTPEAKQQNRNVQIVVIK